MITIIVAYAKNRVIGKDGKIPWSIPEDLAHFKKLTYGHPVIMGRKTWDSLPKKCRPLPGRTNVVISTKATELQQFYSPTDPVWANDIKNAIRLSKIYDPHKEIFIIGGSQIYKLALSLGCVNRIVASELHDDYQGDVFFPHVDWPSVVLAQHPSFNIVEYRNCHESRSN